MAQAGIVLLIGLIATITEAQQPARQTKRDTAGVKPPVGVQQTAIAAPETPQAALSLLDKPAQPAQVQLNAGKLSVKADNSTLSAILHDISAKTGMKIDGLSRDQRIFGNYGPAAPREVLSALLDGVDYNVMMVGELANGAPRELTLTPRTGGAVTGGSPAMQMAQQNSSSDDEDDSVVEQQDNPVPPRPETMAPETETPHSPAQSGQVKTPQQMLQELQQMRQQQLQQQQQQVNPQ
ncbi:hypothetical protein [Alloacidobacterium sp.]|uniref:hypothetical protein n=1 Tax=Alloacidobacterium sp. TaxID=2951999 RepID=UPI002D42AEC0|nr:hypothetical protein [Alloacidobacterium sp.]HYK37392.1 hypothetical protein [Alloacidobacterium sp.]